MMKRPSIDEYYLSIAEAVAQRSTCLRAQAGAIIVKNDVIVATGYVGSPRGEKNCCDYGICERTEKHILPGHNYELCESVHAEANAIINAARSGNSVYEGTIYIYFRRLDQQKIKHGGPCIMCKRMLKNAGISNIIIEEVV